jgi:hypothetical protein
MAARDYFEAVEKPGCVRSYRALLGMALIDPDRYHMCKSFRAYSLRGAYSCKETFKERYTVKTLLVHYGNVSCFYDATSDSLYAVYFSNGAILVEHYSISNIRCSTRNLVNFASAVSIDELMDLMG